MIKRLCTCVTFYFGVLNLAYAQPDFESLPKGPPPDVQTVPEGPIPMISGDARDRPEGLIKLDVMVTDAAGKPAVGLNASDFRLLEDGREQKILSFDAFNGFAVDARGSAISSNLLPGSPQHIQTANLVKQNSEPSLRLSLGRSV